VVRAVIDVRPAAAPATGSLLETRFLQLLRKHGLPTPERQVCVQISPTKRYFVDVAWPELGLFLELDGKQHETQQLHDADRLAAIVEKTGWTYVTLTWHQVVHTPTYTARRIGRLLEAARRTSA
jgi:very-short-patch-repair endonuclease